MTRAVTTAVSVCVKVVTVQFTRSRSHVLFLSQSHHQVMSGRSSTKLHTLLKYRMKHIMTFEGDMTLFSVSSFIVMQWLHNGNCDGCKTCLIFETPSSAHVYIHFKEYSSTVRSMDHSLTHPTEKLFLWYHFNRLWNSSCGHNSQCVFILIKSVTSNHFISRFQNFFERQNVKWTVLNWWKKNVSLKTYCPFCI
jgi:hypothetical protein